MSMPGVFIYEGERMSSIYNLVLVCGALALVYGAYAVRSVLSAPAGNERMQEIAALNPAGS